MIFFHRKKKANAGRLVTKDEQDQSARHHGTAPGHPVFVTGSSCGESLELDPAESKFRKVAIGVHREASSWRCPQVEVRSTCQASVPSTHAPRAACGQRQWQPLGRLPLASVFPSVLCVQGLGEGGCRLARNCHVRRWRNCAINSRVGRGKQKCC